MKAIQLSFLILTCGLTQGQLVTESAGAFSQALQAILNVGPQGQGNPEATAAWPVLAAAKPKDLPQLLSALNKANALSANWLRAAAESIVEREIGSGGQLPLEKLGEFLLDTKNQARARRLAYEWIERVEPEAAHQLLPGMLNDPGQALRRDAVSWLLNQAEPMLKTPDPAPTVLIYRQALGFARDVDQVNTIVAQLREWGQVMDVPRQFGFLMHWKVIGPFDNSERKGFDTACPPELKDDLTATYPGKKGSVRWTDVVTSHEYGLVDLNNVYGPLKEVLAYASADFVTQDSRSVELRFGCKNAWKVWLNGDLLFARDEYHRGMRVDQYQLAATLRPGHNRILLKLCQNEQTEEWTKEWQFQLRVCDSLGAPVLSDDRPPTPVPSSPTRATPRGGTPQPNEN